MRRINCWEALKCGREPGGSRVDQLGVCPAALKQEYDGINGGKNAGRICWAVAGTLCEGRVQGIFALKIDNCLKCKFFRKVADREGSEFHLSPPEKPDSDKQFEDTARIVVPAESDH